MRPSPRIGAAQQNGCNSGSLAQLVEQLTFNQLVAGSNPARPTTSSGLPEYRCKDSLKNGSLAQLVEQLTFNQLVAGSNPARPTILFIQTTLKKR